MVSGSTGWASFLSARAGSVRPSFSPDRQLLAVLLVASGIALISALVVPLGFQGRDDLRYLMAAQRWLETGPYPGPDHWSNRLPYVLSVAGAYRLTGSWEIGLLLLHSLSFVTAAGLLWLIGREVFASRRTAWTGLLIYLSTPLLFRLPSTFYPEALELALGLAVVAAVLLTVNAHPTRRLWWLGIAGLVAGVIVSIRQTSLALPASLGLLILLSAEAPLPQRLKEAAALTVGFLIPVMAELLYFAILTGNPLYRLTIDAGHAELVSSGRLAGDAPVHGGALFNWNLASRWRIPSIVDSHWTIAPIVRLFTSPGMLLIPWAALVGGVVAWRMGNGQRRFVLLVAGFILLQYGMNTFVLALPPNTRYFGVALALMCLLAARALAAISDWRLAATAFLLAFFLPNVAVALTQPRPSVSIAALDQRVRSAEEVIHVSGQLARMSVLPVRDRPAWRAVVREGLPPVGGLSASLFYEAPMQARCSTGAPAFAPVAVLGRPTLAGGLVAKLGLTPYVPRRARTLLDARSDYVRIVRRIC